MDTIVDPLAKLAHNPPLPSKLRPVSLVGKAGTSLYIDGRRIRVLKDQPRSEENLGFSQDSIRDLAGSIKLIGQLEDGVVCPIVDDPAYDAQLIDAERRHRACLFAGIMLRVTVREDVDANDSKALYLLSVARNNGKEPQTSIEYARIVYRLRTEHKMTFKEIAGVLGKSEAWVAQHSSLLKLQPEVQAALAPSEESKGRRLTFQLAIMLVKFSPEDQVRLARHILDEGLNMAQGRRYILKYQRGLGSKAPKGRGRPSEYFKSLSTLVKRSTEQFGVFTDFRDREINAMVEKVKREERRDIRRKLELLASCLIHIGKLVSPIAVATVSTDQNKQSLTSR